MIKLLFVNVLIDWTAPIVNQKLEGVVIHPMGQSESLSYPGPA